MAASAEKYRYVFLLVLTIGYAAGAMLHARAKPFWYDEIFTMMAASAPTAAATWHAAKLLDAAPPLTHLLTHFAIHWFGGGEIAGRLPQIAGFWIFCLAMYRFVGRRLEIFYGLAALLLPLGTQAYEYAYEARPYGLVLGFCGILLVCWQSAADRGCTRLRYAGACAGVALSFAGALLSHYYAALLYVPLAGAEAYRSWKARRIDWGIWLAMALGSAPLIWRFATIRTVVSGFVRTSSTWSDLYPFQVLNFWNDGLQASLCVLVLALAVMALRTRKSPDPLEQSADRPAAFPAHELLAALLFLTLPVIALGGGLLVTGVYSARYALAAFAGVVVLLPAVTAHVSGGRSLPAFLLAALAILPAVLVTGTAAGPRNVLSEERLLMDALNQGPVVIPDGQFFLQMWFYLPEPMKSRVVFLVDGEAAVKYQVYNTASIDGALSFARQYYPIPVVDYRSFAVPGKSFRLLQTPFMPGWVLAKVVADGGQAVIDRYTPLRQLYQVKLP